ncbi:unnamed protein product [Closterium sp. Naga37s-1]|nr:unnamed protein product [Closterium sp. Naga37s-1]
MDNAGRGWIEVLCRELGHYEEKDDDELTQADEDLAQDAGHDFIYDVACEDTFADAVETQEQDVDDGIAGVEGEAVSLEGAEEEDDEETESEYGDPIQGDQEGFAEEEEDAEQETEYIKASEGDDDEDSSEEEDDEESEFDFSDASDDDMEEGGGDEQGQEGVSSSHNRASEGVDFIMEGRDLMRVKLVNLNEEQIRSWEGGAPLGKSDSPTCSSASAAAAPRLRAQGLSDDHCPNTDIGAMGGWEQGEMRKAYMIGNHCLRKESGMKDVRNGELQAHLRDLQIANKMLKEEEGTAQGRVVRSQGFLASNIGIDHAAAGGVGSSKMGEGGAGQSTPEPATPSPEMVYFDCVVRPWRESTTVAEAWALWNKSSFLVEGQTLRALAQERGLFVKYAKFKRGEEIKGENGKFGPTNLLKAKDSGC